MIGGWRLKINLAKYDKKSEEKKVERKQQSKNYYTTKEYNKRKQVNQNQKTFTYEQRSSNLRDGCSYKEVIHGSKVHVGSAKAIELATNISILGRLDKCWISKTTSIDHLRNIHDLLKEDGLGDCKIQYVGGLSVICEWKSREIAMRSLDANKERLKHCFSDIKI